MQGAAFAGYSHCLRAVAIQERPAGVLCVLCVCVCVCERERERESRNPRKTCRYHTQLAPCVCVCVCVCVLTPVYRHGECKVLLTTSSTKSHSTAGENTSQFTRRREYLPAHTHIQLPERVPTNSQSATLQAKMGGDRRTRAHHRHTHTHTHAHTRTHARTYTG